MSHFPKLSIAFLRSNDCRVAGIRTNLFELDACSCCSIASYLGQRKDLLFRIILWNAATDVALIPCNMFSTTLACHAVIA